MLDSARSDNHVINELILAMNESFTCYICTMGFSTHQKTPKDMCEISMQGKLISVRSDRWRTLITSKNLVVSIIGPLSINQSSKQETIVDLAWISESTQSWRWPKQFSTLSLFSHRNNCQNLRFLQIKQQFLPWKHLRSTSPSRTIFWQHL